MFVLQKRIHPCKTRATLVQPYLMGSSMDHGFALFCFGFDVCKPLLEAEVYNQYLLSAANYFTKWLEVSPGRRQESLRIIKFLTRYDKVIYRNDFEHTVIQWVYEGLAVHPPQHSTGWGKSSLGMAVFREKHSASGTGHIPLLVSYRAFLIVSSLLGETCLCTFVNKTVNGQENTWLVPASHPNGSTLHGPNCKLLGPKQGPGWWQAAWLAKACLICVLLEVMHFLECTPLRSLP